MSNMLPIIYCLLIALDARMLSHNRHGPGPMAQGPKAAGRQVPDPAAFGPWSLVLGPYPCASSPVKRQSMRNIYIYIVGNTYEVSNGYYEYIFVCIYTYRDTIKIKSVMYHISRLIYIYI